MMAMMSMTMMMIITLKMFVLNRENIFFNCGIGGLGGDAARG